jgi:hypothetical protein
MIKIKLDKEFVLRFWSKVDIGKSDKCWEWKRGTQSKGYGSVSIGNKKTALAHRVAYFLEEGEIPEKMVVRHKCDNRLCCNPRHLEIGTIADNNRDAKERGRIAIGEGHGRTKFSDETVEGFREKYETGNYSISELARMCKMSQSYASGIVRGKYRNFPLV